MKKSVFVLCIKAQSFSGQQFALDIVVQGLHDRGWDISKLELPIIDRTTKGLTGSFSTVLNIMQLLPRMLLIWSKVVFLSRNCILYIGLGQTKFSLIREGFPILLSGISKRFDGVVIALNGSNFMNWTEKDFETKLFLAISNFADVISVVGPTQYKKMIWLGIPENKLVIMDNTCLLRETSNVAIESKHQQAPDEFSENKIKILFLSSLIESKGYVQFVEAIAHLSKNTSLSIEATLCGKAIFKQEANQKFNSIEAVKSWLNQTIDEINTSPTVHIQWIEGAIGEEKEKLFLQSQIFVLPTFYKTEAQPIVLLEALASGCAIITTKVGEIESTLDTDTAVFLDKCSASETAKAIEVLMLDATGRKEMAINGLQLFQTRFSFSQHIEKWESIIKNLKK
jgi:glycosyltransferase involved in cell wall biosynthesis